jgi:hypothetical protein
MKALLAAAAGASVMLMLGSNEWRALQTKELPHSTPELGTFAFADPAGARLLSVGGPSAPGALRTALCSDGNKFPVRFERRQVETIRWNGRQSPYQFDNVAGDLFSLVQGKIDDAFDVTCFLAADALMSSATWLPTYPSQSKASARCPANIEPRLVASRSRAVTHCWPIAEGPDGRRVVLAEFAREGADVLASVVLIDRDRLVFADDHATFKKEGDDLWRVDDGGALSPEGFRIVFLVQRGRSFVLGVSWPGAEGQSLSVCVSDDESRFTRVLSDYWYQAPV